MHLCVDRARVTGWIWMGALISKLCFDWASMCQCKGSSGTGPDPRTACWMEYFHNMSLCLSKEHCDSERGQSGNMLLIVVWGHWRQRGPCIFCWSHHYVTCAWCGSNSIPAFSVSLRCVARHSWLKASQPHDLAYPPRACGLSASPRCSGVSCCMQ